MTIISFFFIVYLSTLLVKIGIILLDIIQKRYSKQFKRFIIDFSFGCIYLFSKFQIVVIRLNNKLNTFIDENPFLLKIKNYINKILSEINYYNITVEYENKFCIKNYVENGFTYKKIIFDGQETTDLFELSDIKFILLEFSIGETDYDKYKIDLKTDSFTYYLVGNKFKKDFFIFYIKNHLNINDKAIKDDKCSLKIIDPHINSVNFEFKNENDSIMLEKNGYKLISTIKSDIYY
jgi:hypothetical protein